MLLANLNLPAARYKRRLQLKGLLYFHRISDHRVGGTSSKNLGFFKELFGTELDKVVLTTTMWDDVDEETGIEREEQLRLIYWQSMITQGSSVQRFMGDRESALEILRPIVARMKKVPYQMPSNSCATEMTAADLSIKDNIIV